MRGISAFFALVLGLFATAAMAESIRVLTFNIANDGRFGLPGVIGLIGNSNADVIGLQEAASTGCGIAKKLGLNCALHGDTAILTRFKIEKSSTHHNGVLIATPSGARFAFFDLHLIDHPYQPFQLLGIPYGTSNHFIHTESEAIAEAKHARGAKVAEVLKDIAGFAKFPIIVTGDFNEPSFMDWTGAAALIGRHPIKVDWPTTRAFANAGFTDTYRSFYPDEVASPGFTWTPTTADTDPNDHHDRIDFVLYRGALAPASIDIIGEDVANATLVVSPFPSDHRAVLARFEL